MRIDTIHVRDATAGAGGTIAALATFYTLYTCPAGKQARVRVRFSNQLSVGGASEIDIYHFKSGDTQAHGGMGQIFGSPIDGGGAGSGQPVETEVFSMQAGDTIDLEIYGNLGQHFFEVEGFEITP
jgi:hypothetical protein